jgi:hypothetical protein
MRQDAPGDERADGPCAFGLSRGGQRVCVEPSRNRAVADSGLPRIGHDGRHFYIPPSYIPVPFGAGARPAHFPSGSHLAGAGKCGTSPRISNIVVFPENIEWLRLERGSPAHD